MDSKRELTPNELERRNKWQDKHRRLNTDSPDSDFAESVRAYLIHKNFFTPLSDEGMVTAAQRARTPLTLTDSPFERSMMTPSPLLK